MTATLQSGLYVITDCESLPADELLQRTMRILNAGISALQYRNKSADGPARLAQAAALRDLCREFDTPLIINDDIELAAMVAADGVHLGRDDPPYELARQRLGTRAIVGVSCNDDPERALRAQRSGADYVAFGAFFPTRSKIAPARADATLLTRVRASLHIPIVAIGGITPDNGAALVSAGADLLAVIGSVYGNSEPEHVVRKFAGLFPARLDDGNT